MPKELLTKFCFEGYGLQPVRRILENTGALAPEGTDASIVRI
jgi:hypothetical protein